MEILTYSIEQLNAQTNTPEKWNKDSTVTIMFYGNDQFTDRRSKNEERSSFSDTEVVFEGEVDETQITFHKRSMYDVYKETRDILEERNYPNDDVYPNASTPVSMEEMMLKVNQHYGRPDSDQ